MKTETSKKEILKKLFFSNLYISAFTFGGGFVIITFMKHKYVTELNWMTEDEMLDLTALAQSSPGAIAVNAAILVGRHMGGFWGMVCSVIGTIIPPMVILSVISMFYAAFASNVYVALILRGMQSGVAAVILDVVFGLGDNAIKEAPLLNSLIIVCAFVATFFMKVNVAFVIIAAALLGVVRFYIGEKRGTK